MKNNDSDDDFLTTLYKRSATEKPSAELDDSILALAKANHQQRPFAKTMNLQRIVSIAAVMTFTVYIFFEVDKEPSKHMIQELSSPPSTMLRSSPSTLAIESLEKTDNVQTIQTLKMKQAKKSVKQAPAEFMADEVEELSAQETRINDIDSESAENKSKPEYMLDKIRELLASGKVVEAKIMFDEFKLAFPDYATPDSIRDEFK
tara:strand:+ start:51914 stop:52525 length:612 start_codon:yes stop_codon:yes gene_type:complete